MAHSTIIVSMGQKFGNGSYSVKSISLGNDVFGAAATGTADAATLLTLAGTLGVTGTQASSVTLTAAQATSLAAAISLVSTDLATIATDTAAGDVVIGVNTTNISTASQLGAAVRAAEHFAFGAGFKP